MYKCMECGCVFEESEADWRWSELGDSLPPMVQVIMCPACGETALEDYYEDEEEEDDL